MYSYEIDAMKRDLERLRLEFNSEKNEHERTKRALHEATSRLEGICRDVTGLLESERRLTGDVTELLESKHQLTERVPVAELLVQASTRMTGLLGVLAHDEVTTVRKLEAVTERLPSRTIITGGSPYLTRWYLWPEGPRDVHDEGSDLPFAMFLHKFHRGDADRDQHNHPWGLSVAIVLAGGYREERGDETRVMLPGTINVIRGDDFHRVDLLNPTMGSWSLFVAGRKTGGWGFKDRTTGMVTPWEPYLAAKEAKATKAHVAIDPTGHHVEDNGTNYG